MKNKLKATLAAAALIGAALIAGAVDNDYQAQRQTAKTECHYITTPDGTSFCR